MPVAPPSPAELSAFKTLRTIADIANFLGTSEKRLAFHLYSGHRPTYKTFTIPKSSGGQRAIASPPQVISLFQTRVLSCMTALVQPKGPAHGFTSKKSVVTNASLHVGTNLVLNIDLLDFFPSIHFGRIRGVFTHQPFSFNSSIAAVLSQLCSHDRTLPPGAPTSPLLSNLVCRGLDNDLLLLARRTRCKYTRYADDITFSTRSSTFSTDLIEVATPTIALGKELLETLAKHDFKENTLKTRVSTRAERQEVTGLVVNQKVNIHRRYVRNLRAILNNCRHHGLPKAEERFKEKAGNNAPPLAHHLRGKLDYLSMVRGATDGIYLRYAIELERIAQTRKFGVRIAGPEALKLGILKEAMWIVIGRNRSGIEVKQGTAFGLTGWGIISAAHIFETDPTDPVVAWEIIKASPPSTPRNITSWQIAERADLAVITANIRHTAMLSHSERHVQIGESVVLAGFPNWRNPADQLQVQPATVIQTRVASLISYISTNATVREGASGGPILDQAGLVVGVTLQDGTGALAPNGGVAITHLSELLPIA